MSDSAGAPGSSKKLLSVNEKGSSPQTESGDSSPPGGGGSGSAPPQASPSAILPSVSQVDAPPPSSDSSPPSPPKSVSNSKSSPPPSDSPPPPASDATPTSNSPPPQASPPPQEAESPPPPKKSSSPPPSSPPPDSDKQSPPPAEAPPAGGKVTPPHPSSPPPPLSPPASSPPPPAAAAAQSPPSPPASTGSESSPPADSTPPPPPLSPPVADPTTGTLPVTSSPIPPSPTVVSPPTATSAKTHPPPPKNVTRVSPPADSSKTSPAGSSTNGSPGLIVGVTVAGVFVIALIAIFFTVSRRKKKRSEAFSSPYMPPNNYTVNSDGYNYYGQPQSMTFSGPMDPYYGTQPPHSSIVNSSYGSQRGNMYNGGGQESGVIGGKKSVFSYEEVMEITNGFSRQNIIGEGGFGSVYKGWLPDGKAVAVKQLKAGSGQGEREFRAEVDIISVVHHRHLVSLAGYCISEKQRLLIYEFVPNKTLEYHLHEKGLPVLDWTKRIKIALGSAKGLAYLHEDCQPKIIHRDIKSANILLDDAFEAQVADFGLAKLNNDTNTHVSTRVMGTFGYMAPEYASSGKLTDRSDVFSFGVVLLELITGRKPVDPTQPMGDESLVEWARPLLIHAVETGDFSELVDPRLEKHYVESEMFRMIEAAAACVRHSAPKRPRMMQVVRALDSESQMSDLTNGVKYGQSTVYDSGQYNQDIRNFRRMALGSDDSSEFGPHSGEYNSRELSHGVQSSWTSQDNSSEFPSSSEMETRAMNAPTGRAPGNYSGLPF